ncbi:hypothetical protein SAICODRAFT_17830 [Saitoella complicata NRRL Y-17804]|uniref:Protein-serine/threonine kinase n=1 Tax=Saitoella complicata (strain BCRC 22490 / CBS 7301 / JCM 7358 / NBRC 10748 / NRRL Y-17804) TaxID=698492 RepID=A0A0E9NMA6_SAICN|nr:uncharacterized protein SAICODRAFT_17830 [Saitoella complicata NRRL Y-17804]ODQ54842.1 hypothetical protein SAICODRAFT_17830 [Saitoella complicata NRRL Y-17804]GAO50550.1 hypothetical protein G7K_4674-t1 [Saitoella complicata NRRL Y-17804]
MPDPVKILKRLQSTKATLVNLHQIWSSSNHVAKAHNKHEALIRPSSFLYTELATRWALVLKNIEEQAPYGLGDTPTIQWQQQRYHRIIDLLTSRPPPDTPERAKQFGEWLHEFMSEHQSALLGVGRSVNEALDRGATPEQMDDERTNKFFDDFYTLNMGSRLFIAEHLALVRGDETRVVKAIDPAKVAERASADAIRVTSAYFTSSPAPKINIFKAPKVSQTIYVEEHLHRILFEVLKHSIARTHNHHASKASHLSRDRTLPEIRIIIAEGEQDVSIKISDQGGGFPLSTCERIWSYYHSRPPPTGNTTPSFASEINGNSPDPKTQISSFVDYAQVPYESYGHGMPIARLTSRYFGGELAGVHMEGYGSDYFYNLSRDRHIMEGLPKEH